MDHKLKQSFDYIHAEEELKEQTMGYLKQAMDRKEKKKSLGVSYLLTPAAACFILFLCVGLFSHNLYFTPAGYVSVDVNPSVEITLNRFDKVIQTKAFNSEGELILSGLKLKNLGYNDAVRAIVENITSTGYLSETRLVSVTLQTDLSDKEEKMKIALESDVSSVISRHHLTAEIEVMSVDSETISGAHAEDLSPAKYLAIIQLKEVDPSATFENCRNHSIGQLRELTETHHDKDNYPDNQLPYDESNHHKSNHNNKN